MTAAALSRYLPKGRTRITLIESADIGTIGVGEATIPQIATFNRMLGIDEYEFMRTTQATFKLGIEFRDWGALEERYFHPFGKIGFDLEGTEFHHFWRRQKSAGEPHRLEAYSLNASAAYAEKFFKPGASASSTLVDIGYAFHFDASLYAGYLRTPSERNGVHRIEGKVVTVDQDPESGHIDRVGLENGLSVDGQFFIDCTGFFGLLIEKTLKAGYQDWRHWLPMDRAIAAPSQSREPPKPYTIATARSAGWTWKIPLQHRTGNGHVYCSDHMDADAAEKILLDAVDAPLLSEPRHLKFVTGRRAEFWKANCVAIGLSAGFLEPLESTSIHMIQTGIAKLLALFPTTAFSEVERAEYNRLLGVTIAHIRDFIILHYVTTKRADSDFWRFASRMAPPDSLIHKMDLLRTRGRFFRYDDELFSIDSWLAVMEGQGDGPRDYNPVADSLSDANITKSLENMRTLISKTTSAMPTHQAFIERYCKAAPTVEMEPAK